MFQDRDQEMDCCREGVKLWVPKFGDYLTSLGNVSFSRRKFSQLVVSESDIQSDSKL